MKTKILKDFQICISLPFNDLQGAFSKLIIHHFADDTNLLFPVKKFGLVESVVSHELKLLSHWLRSNK